MIVPSDATASKLASTGLPARFIEVVEEGWDHLPPPDDEGASLLLSDIGVEGPYLLSVGTMEPRKNLRRVTRAYAKVRDKLPEPWPLVVVGPGGWGEEVVPEPGVLLAGNVEDGVLAALYSRCRCLVYVPLTEGFGLPALEGMAVGAPVVSSPIPSAAGASLEVDPLDERSIGQGILHAAADDSLRQDLVEAGRRRAGPLTWEAAAKRHVAHWDELVSGRRPRRSGRSARSPHSLRPGRSPQGHSSQAERHVHSSQAHERHATGDRAAGRELSVSIDVSAIPSRAAGAGRYALDLVAALSRNQDASLTLLARVGDDHRWACLAPSATIEDVVPRARPARLVWEQLLMPRHLALAQVDVHHAPHYTMPVRCRVPAVVTIHDLTFFDHPELHQPSKVLFFRRAIRSAVRGADGLVCVSRLTEQRLMEMFSSHGVVRVIPHGVDHARFRPHETQPGSDSMLLEAVGVRPPYIAFVGTLEPRKGLPVLVDAFDRICPAHPRLSLVLAGLPAWGAGEVSKSISSSRHPGKVVRTGYLPDDAIPALLRQAAGVAYPSLYEGFGLPALESLACGSPLITTRGTAMAEVAGDAAILVSPGDADELAEALEAVLEGGAAVSRRRSLGLEIASRHTWSASAQAHLDLYEEVSKPRR